MTIVIALTIHEIGHLIAALMLKVKFQKFKITFFGFNLNINIENIKLFKKIILFSSGPIFNIIVFCTLQYTKYYNFAKINLFLAVINMIPILPLDGGNICKSILGSIIDSTTVCRYMIMTNCFFIVCFSTFFYIYRNWLYVLLIIMAVRGIVEEDRQLLEKNIKVNYYNRIKRNK